MGRRENQHVLRYPWLNSLGLLVLSVASLLLLSTRTHGATLTWDGGGADDNWSTCANWTTDVCPVAADNVVFNGTSSKNAVVDASFTGNITALNINSGYTGTVSLDRSLSLSGAFTQATGNFTAGSQSLDLNGSFTLSGGIFTASSATVTHAGAMTVSGTPTFTHNGGTWIFDGTSSSTLACNGISFNLVTFAHTNGAKTISSNCTMPVGNNPTIGSGTNPDLTINGVLSGSGTVTIASLATGNTLTLGSTGSLSGFTGVATGDLTINGATFNAGSFTTFDVDDAFTLSASGVFTAPAGTMTIAGNMTLSAGTTFNHNSGTLSFDGASTGTLSCNNTTFNSVTFVHPSNTKTVGADCSLPLGSNPTIGVGATADISLSGTLSGTGIVTIGDQEVGNLTTLNTGATFTGFTELRTGDLLISGGSVGSTSLTTIDVSDAFSLSTGTFTAPSGVLRVAGAFTNSVGTTFNHNNGTVELDGTASATISCNNAAFNLVVISHTQNTKTISSNCSLPLGSDPVIGGSSVSRIALSGTLTGTGVLTIGNRDSNNSFNVNTGGAITGFDELHAGIMVILGSFNAGNMDIDVVGNFILASAAVFTAPSGTLSVGNTISFNPGSGANFSHNNGTITLNRGAGWIDCDGAVFNNFTFAHTSGMKTVTSGCNLPVGNDPQIGIGEGQVYLNGATLTGSGLLTVGDAGFNTQILMNNNASINGFDGVDVGVFTLSSTTFDASSFSSFRAGYSLYISANSHFTAPTTGMTVGGVDTASSFYVAPDSTFTQNSGVLQILNGMTSTEFNIICNGNANFNEVELISTGGNFTVYPDCSVPLGHDPVVDYLFLYGGEITGTGELTANNLVLTNFTANIAGFSSLTTDLMTAITIPVDFSPLTDMTVGTLFIGGGAVFTAPSGTLTVTDDLELSSGTFNHGNGAVVIDSADASIGFDATFNDLSVINGGGHEFIVTAGQTLTVAGDLVLHGNTLNDRLSVMSSSAGSTWYIDPQGTADAQYLTISDSTNIGGPITADDSVNSSNNNGWSFAGGFVLTRYQASDLIGQVDGSGNPVWSAGDYWSGTGVPSAQNLGYNQGTAMDTVGHRLFVADCGARVLVFNLDNNNNLIDRVADRVIGQEDFVTEDYTTARDRLNCAAGVTYDTESKRLFVGDNGGSRVLIFDLAGGITNGMDAAYVLGQEDFDSDVDDLERDRMYSPYGGLVYNSDADQLFVSDSGNHRVLVFDFTNGISNGMDAAYVLGQPNFTTADVNVSREGMSYPYGLALDQEGERLFVAECNSRRVLVFDLSAGLASGMDAANVIGQDDFTTVENAVSSTRVGCVTGLAYDAAGERLFVQDDTTYRVLIFDVSAITDGEAAVAVLGASSFTEDRTGCPASQELLCDPEGLTDYFDTTNNRLYLSDSSNARVVIYDFVRITTTSLSAPKMNANYSKSLATTASQGSESFALASGSLPTGLSLSPTGLISGVPTKAGTYKFTVEVTDDMGDVGYFNDTQSYTLVVKQPSSGNSSGGASGEEDTPEPVTPDYVVTTGGEIDEEPEDKDKSEREEPDSEPTPPIVVPTDEKPVNRPSPQATSGSLNWWVWGGGFLFLLLVLRLAVALRRRPAQ